MHPLDGTTVADLTLYLPGPFASRELQRLGAHVVKIEPPTGDPLEASSPAWYQAINEGKEIVAWDARAEPPPPVLGEADIVLEGFRPGVWERLGIALSDSAILCSITGFGAEGALARRAGHDLNYLGYAGALADTAPAIPPIQIADLAAGAQGAAIEILAALLERERTGSGTHIVISMTHGTHRLIAHRLGGDPLPHLLTGGVACYRIYETADRRHLTVAALEPRFWHRLCELIERPDLAEHAFEQELPELAELFRSQSLAHWLALLEDEDTCVGPVLSLEEAAQRLA